MEKSPSTVVLYYYNIIKRSCVGGHREVEGHVLIFWATTMMNGSPPTNNHMTPLAGHLFTGGGGGFVSCASHRSFIMGDCCPEGRKRKVKRRTRSAGNSFKGPSEKNGWKCLRNLD